MTELIADCPAKINLGLEITGRRADGYHDLVTIFQTVSLADHLGVAPADDLVFTCSEPALATPDNLCVRAARALQAATGIRRGARLHLTKRIPAAAGLGGGSSDAAAALRLLDTLWGTALPPAALAGIAARLGADVPFFLHGGAALATGIGDEIDPLPAPAMAWLVLLRPAVEIAGKTARLYRALTPADWSDGGRTRAQAARLRAGQPPDPRLLVNSFRRPLLAEFPTVAAAEAALRRAGATAILPAGSGPTLLAWADDERQAITLGEAVRAGGWESMVVHTA